jgi:hypothetical protein
MLDEVREPIAAAGIVRRADAVRDAHGNGGNAVILAEKHRESVRQRAPLDRRHDRERILFEREGARGLSGLGAWGRATGDEEMRAHEQ